MSYRKQDEVPIGSIVYFSSESIPESYLVCDGAEISRTTFSELFGVIGETWGNGDSSTTFEIPNLCGRFLRAGGTIAATQTDCFSKHNHNGFTLLLEVGGGLDNGSDPNYDPYSLIDTDIFLSDEQILEMSGWGMPVNYNLGTGTALTYGLETRPYNTGLLACIKWIKDC